MLKKLNKHLLLLLAVFVLFILIPTSFAEDLNDTQTIASSDVDTQIITDTNTNNTIYVSTSGDDDNGDGSEAKPYASVSKAVDKYNSSVNSNIFIKNGNYTVTDTIIINKTINIAGESSTGVILDANHQTYIFKVTDKATASLTNLTLMNGNSTGKGTYSSDYPGGAIAIPYATAVNVDNCRFINNLNSAISYYSYTETTLTITNSVFENNTANGKPNYGGAIYFGGSGVLNVANTTFKNNCIGSIYGDGGAVYLANNAKSATFDKCKFINNSAHAGGAIGAYCAGDINVFNCVFENNTATNNKGGAIYDKQINSKYLILSVKNNTYINNSPANSTIYIEGNVNIVDLDTNTRMNASNVDMRYGADENFTVTLTDDNGTPLVGQDIIITLTNYYKNVTTFTVKTNSNGQAIVSLKKQNPGRYSVLSTFDGTSQYSAVNRTNSIKICSNEDNALVLIPSKVTMSEGDSVNITGYVVDEYWEPTTAFDGCSYHVEWKDHSGDHHAISGGLFVYDGEFTFDLSRCHLSTQDELYNVTFIVEDDYSYAELNASVEVDMSKIMPPVPEDIKVIYVAKNGNDTTGTGSEDKPLASVQMALYVNSKFGGNKTIFVKEGIYDIAVYTLYDNVTVIGQYNKTIFRQHTGDMGMFMIDQGTVANFTNITFINGYTTPTPYSLLTVRYDTVVNIDGCIFRNNTCLNGGAIAVSWGAVANINNSIFEDNKAILITSEGGAIWVYQGTLNVYNSLFYNNTACDGGAIYFGHGSIANIVNTTFDNNTAYKTTIEIGGGGAIYATSDVDIKIDNSTFVNNYADLTAGAIYLSGSNMTITKSYFENNKVKNDGHSKPTDIGSDQTYPTFLNVTYTVFITNSSYFDQVSFGGYGEEYYIDLDGNYWGRNSKGRTSEPLHNWVIIQADIDKSFVEVGDNVEINIKFKGYSQDGTFDLNGSMHDFKVDLTPTLNKVNPSTVTIVDNVAKTNYTATNEGNETINFTDVNGKVIYVLSFEVEKHIDRINSTLSADNLEMYYLDGSKFAAKLVNVNGTPIANATVSFTINNVTYNRITDANGNAYLNINLNDGSYNISSVFEGNRYYYPSKSINNTVLVKPVATAMTVSADDILVGDEAVITAKINATEGVVLFNISGNAQYATVTDGTATARFANLGNGTYTVVAKYDKFKGYLGCENTTSFTVNKVSKYDFNADVSDVKVGEDVTVNVDLPDDANGEVVAIIGTNNYTANVVKGSAKITISNLTMGKYNISIVYKGDSKYASSTIYKTVNVGKSDVIFTVVDLEKYMGGSEKLEAILLDINGNAIANESVIFNVNGKDYVRYTDENGSAFMNIGLTPGKYDVSAKFNGTKDYNSARANATVVIKSTTAGQNIVKMFRNTTQYYALFLDGNGKALVNTTIKFNINGVMYERKTNESGIAKLNINLNAGDYVITNYNTVTGEENSNNITVKSLIVDNYDLTKYYLNGSKYTIKVIGKDGNIAANQEVTFNINGAIYKRTTGDDGIVSLNINLRPGNYRVTAEYEGCRVSNSITVLDTLITKDLSMNYKDGSKFTATVLDGQGRPLANQNVAFNVNGVFYYKNTNDKGIASLNINLMRGKYIITSAWNNYQVGNNIIIS